MHLLGFLVATYGLASIPTGLLIARRLGVDLRSVGSGNIGTANATRALGKRWGIVVLLLDASKGALPVLLAQRIFSSSMVPAVVGLAAVLGQVFSIFLRGRGGKGVATSFGAGLALAPFSALAALGTFVLLFTLTRIAAVGSLGAILSYPCFLVLLGSASQPNLGFFAVVAVVVVFRHRENLQRLLKGKENRL